MSKKRLTIEFSDKDYQVLSRLADGAGMAKKQVINQAVRLMKYVTEETARGNRLELFCPADNSRKQIALL